MKRSAPMMLKAQQRLELKPKHALANAEWLKIADNTDRSVKPLQRGAIFISSSENCLTSDSLLKQLVNLYLTRKPHVHGSKVSKSALHKNRVHSRRKAQFAAIDKNTPATKQRSSDF